MSVFPTDEPDRARPVHGGSRIFSLEHREIGLTYLVSALIAFFLGGMLAMVLRTELIIPGVTLADVETYGRLFTLHGAVLVFLFAVPAIPFGLGNLVLPPMLGVRNVACPRINRAGLWSWIAGAVTLTAAIVLGSVGTGWMLLAPYESTGTAALVVLTLGLLLLGAGSTMNGLNFIFTIARRARSVGWSEIPLFAWALLGTAWTHVAVAPVLGLTAILSIAARLFDAGPARDNPVLLWNLVGFYAQPMAYVSILPAIGVISELIASATGRRIAGRRWIAGSSIALAVLVLPAGVRRAIELLGPEGELVSGVLAIALALPFAVVLIAWLRTLHGGWLRTGTPMLYALTFVFLLGLSGLSGLFLAVGSLGGHLRGSYFAVAHLHFALFGGTTIALLGGLHQWWPRISGRAYNETAGRVAFGAVFAGFVLTFVPWLPLGSGAMARRYIDYPERLTTLHQLSSVGAYLTAAGFLLMLSYLVHSIYRGAAARPDDGSS